MQIYENIKLSDYTTMRVGGNARYFVIAESLEDLRQAILFAQEKQVEFHVLGGGSNTIFGDSGFGGLVIYMKMRGVAIADSYLEAGAGENWDEVVLKSVESGLSGIEALSHIPGTFGGAIVQNIGAYGQEIGETVEYVDVFDTEKLKRIRMGRDQCAFAYRESIFKFNAKGKLIVMGAMLRLKKGVGKLPQHKDVVDYFASQNISNPSVNQIREAVISIRDRKLPNPAEIPNSGSFFKIPLVGIEELNRVREKYPDVQYFPTNDGRYKVVSGMLIDAVGLKGYVHGKAQISPKHALVITNPTGEASASDILDLAKLVQDKIYEAVGIKLEPEPVIVAK
jgi:UDP-N-acetylmuramate dehydrogenase